MTTTPVGAPSLCAGLQDSDWLGLWGAGVRAPRNTGSGGRDGARIQNAACILVGAGIGACYGARRCGGDGVTVSGSPRRPRNRTPTRRVWWVWRVLVLLAEAATRSYNVSSVSPFGNIAAILR